MMSLKRDAWIVVANGRHVRLLRNACPPAHPTAVRLQLMDAPRLDAPDVGPSGSQPQDVNLGEASFNRQLARWLNQQALDHRFEQLVLAADPVSLGELRPQLHPEVRARLVAEVAKDWTNLPLEQIEQAVQALHA